MNSAVPLRWIITAATLILEKYYGNGTLCARKTCAHQRLG